MKRQFDAVCRQYEMKSVSGEGHAEWSDGLKSGLPSVKLLGKTEQQSYTGKNLFDLSSAVFSKTAYLDTVTVDGDKVTFKGTGYFVYTQMSDIFSAEGHTLSFDVLEFSDSGDSNIRCTLLAYFTDGTLVESSTKYVLGKRVAVTLWPNGKTIQNFEIRLFRKDNNTTSMTATIANIQLERGYTATAYEPYVGGIPAPNPQYPQEVKANNATVRSCGKNLFNPESTFYIYGFTPDQRFLPKYEDGVYYPSGLHGSDYGSMICLPTKPGKTYALSYEIVAGTPLNGAIIGYTDRDENGLGSGFMRIKGGILPTPCVFTIPEGIKYIGVSLVFSGTRYAVGLRNIQIEEDTTATAYEPYVGGEATAPHLMCAVDSSCQSVYNPQTGEFVNWWWDKITLDGSESWREYPARQGFFLAGALPENMSIQTHWCNMALIGSSAFTDSQVVCGLGNKVLYYIHNPFYDVDLPDSGLANWKAHLAEHPLEVWVARNEPEITNIGAQRLTCPTGYGQIIQVAGDIPDCPLEVSYLAHGGNVK